MSEEPNAVFILGYAAGRKSPPKGITRAEWADVVKWATHATTGGYFNPLHALCVRKVAERIRGGAA